MSCLRQPPGRCRPTVLALALLAAFGPAQADTVTETSVSAGAGFFLEGGRDDRALFDQYSGLRPRDHAFGIFGADYYRRNDDNGVTVGLTISDLLTRNRELGLRWGRQGDWKIQAHYGELLRREPLIPDSALVGTGTANPQVVTVPRGGGFDQDLSTKRTGLGFAFSKVISTRLVFEASARTERKEGARLFGIGMACPTSIDATCRGTTGVDLGSALLYLPEPIDADHHQVEARLAYALDKLRLSLGYYGSFYQNQFGSMTPGLPPTLLNPLGAPLPLNAGLRGILSQPVALPPDNQAHHLDLAGNYAFSGTTNLNFKLARGRVSQTDSFAAAGFTALPPGVNDLGGRVTTTLAYLGLSARPLPKLSLLANLRWEDRDDDTPLAGYNVESGVTATNRQLPLRSLRGKAQASYQFTPDWRGSVAAERLELDRRGFTPTSVAAGTTALRRETDETTWRAEVRKSMREDLSGALRYERSERSGSNWLRDNSGLGVTEIPDPAAPGTGLDRGIFPPTLADREREKFGLTIDWQPSDDLSLQVSADSGDDEYSAPGRYGVRRARMTFFNVDVNYALTSAWNVNAYLSRGSQELDHGRPEAVFMAMRNRETAVGLGVNGKAASKLEVGGSIAWLQDYATFAQVLDATASPAAAALLAASGGLPPITFRQHAVKLFGKYTFDKKSDVRAELAHYRTRWDDWAWSNNGTPFTFSDGTIVRQKQLQRVTLLRVVYTYRWQ